MPDMAAGCSVWHHYVMLFMMRAYEGCRCALRQAQGLQLNPSLPAAMAPPSRSCGVVYENQLLLV